LGIFGILFCLILVSQIEWIVENVRALKFLLNYCSTHSYGIFLIHSFLIVFVELQFGWVGIAGNPKVALGKIIFVVVGSMLLAYPLTLLSRRIIKGVNGIYLRVTSTPSSPN